MIKKALLLVLLYTSMQSFCQDFEGVIDYTLSYASLEKDSDANLEELIALFGTQSTFITKDGEYKQLSNGQFLNYLLYKPKTARLYYKDALDGDTLFYTNVNAYDNTDFDLRIFKNADTILGHPCHKLVYKTENVEEHYYFAPDLKINPVHYENHTYANKNKLVALMRSVYLRHEMRINGVLLKMIATEIQPFNIKDSVFAPPEDVPKIERNF